MKLIRSAALVLAAVAAVGLLVAEEAPSTPQPVTQPATQPAAQPVTEPLMTRVCYIIGMDIGRKFAADEIRPDVDAFSAGILAGLRGDQPRYTDEEIRATMEDFDMHIRTERARHDRELAQINREKGRSFCAAHAQEPGVTVLASGLQYKVLGPGTGRRPGAADKVTVHYRGTLIDGAEFDSSHKRGTPASFPVRGVIAGWTEALQLMQEGAKWQLVIPADLAYGDERKGAVIAPGSTLVFEVELLKVEPAAAGAE